MDKLLLPLPGALPGPVQRRGPAASALVVSILIGLGTISAGPAVAESDVQAALLATSDRTLTGGATTVFATGRNAFSFPAANLSDAERTRFAIGNSFFRRNWVEAPSSTTARDGLGPHFVARSCGGCHVQDGRGAPPDFRRGLRADARNEAPIALFLRLSVPGQGEHGGVMPEPTYGDQFNNAAVDGVRPEGQVSLHYSPVRVRLRDGTRHTLLQPHYGVKDLAYGPMAPEVMMSPRIAPQLPGVGLLEAIPDTEILANASAQAAAHARGHPVHGKVNRVWDLMTQGERIGRFGWKAGAGSVMQQTVGAFAGDIGITSPLVPREPCMPLQSDCLAAPRGARGQGPEIDGSTLDNVVFYQAVLAPPARRGAEGLEVLRGERLFHQAQCSSCHRASYVTGPVPFPRLSSPALEGQTIWPYTDLLLHDMGEGLADGRPEYQASGRHWKTPPLWGIGLIRDVNGHQRLLHDGRARGVLEAVLWHDGEARASRDTVKRWSAEDRKALVTFVNSL